MITCDCIKLRWCKTEGKKFALAMLALSWLVLGESVCSYVVAEDWLFERGNLQSTGVAPSSLPASPVERWRYEQPGTSFEATVVVAQGIAYVGDTDGTFHAINISTGKAVWTKIFEETGFLSAAAIEGDHLWVGDYDGTVRCLSLKEGAERWQATLPAEIMAGPVVYQGNLLVTTEAGTFTSFDAKSGQRQWEFTIDAPLRCTPTVVAGKALLAGCDGNLHTIDLATGKQVATFGIGGPTGNTPVASKKCLYFGTEEGTFYAIDVEKEPMKILWKYTDPRRRQGIRTAAAVTDKLAIYGSQGKRVYAVDLATGEAKWTFPTRTRVESSPLVTGKSVIVATQRGRLHLIDLVTGKATWSHNAGGGFVASPVVVDSQLLLGNTDGTLYCFGEKKEP